ncbi:MAG TPA: hypothetical protein VMW66_00040 [Elusimicrobiales bacterium]|nr:hypothetical protein [Elusimicrobiales bacterium]
MKNIKILNLPLVCLMVCQLSCSRPKESIKRKLATIPLLLSLKEAREKYKVKDETKTFKSALVSKHEKAFSFPRKYLPAKESAALGSFYKDKLWRLEITYLPSYTKKVSWRKFLKKSKCKNYNSTKIENIFPLSKQITFQGQDKDTVISCTKDFFFKNKETYYYFSIEDMTISNQVWQEHFMKNKKMFLYANCKDYPSCYTTAKELLKEGKCRDSMYYFTQAIKYKPDNAASWYYRALAKKELGYFTYSRADFKKAVKLDASLKSKDNEIGMPLNDLNIRCIEIID